MCKEHKNINLGFTAEPFPEGTHMCLIYNNEEERARVISKFLEAGVKEKEQVSYLAYDMNKEEMDNWLRSAGVSISENEIILSSTTEAYCPTGEFIPENMLNKLRQLYDDSKKNNYSSARISGEMIWALDNISGSERLMEYESLINRVVVTHPITAICQYDANKFDGATILNCLKVHPYMIIKSQIVKNPYYLKPEEYLEENN
ncbi:MAG: MEDS domain-containing protein [Cyclobacteriaceae bacterium]|nr:MEDS domain-containing protein [Cyclobacteriaceae bacterium]